MENEEKKINVRDLILQVLERQAANDKELSLQLRLAQETVRSRIAESRLQAVIEKDGMIPPADVATVEAMVEEAAVPELVE